MEMEITSTGSEHTSANSELNPHPPTAVTATVVDAEAVFDVESIPTNQHDDHVQKKGADVDERSSGNTPLRRSKKERKPPEDDIMQHYADAFLELTPDLINTKDIWQHWCKVQDVFSIPINLQIRTYPGFAARLSNVKAEGDPTGEASKSQRKSYGKRECCRKLKVRPGFDLLPEELLTTKDTDERAARFWTHVRQQPQQPPEEETITIEAVTLAGTESEIISVNQMSGMVEEDLKNRVEGKAMKKRIEVMDSVLEWDDVMDQKLIEGCQKELQKVLSRLRYHKNAIAKAKLAISHNQRELLEKNRQLAKVNEEYAEEKRLHQQLAAKYDESERKMESWKKTAYDLGYQRDATGGGLIVHSPLLPKPSKKRKRSQYDEPKPTED